jgi:hypothetical protein
MRSAQAETSRHRLRHRALSRSREASLAPSLGLDLSEPYIGHAKRHLSRWSRINLLVGNGESISTPDASFDVVTSIFMFHELPEVRRTIFGEYARVQRGDEPDYEGLLELFPQNYHEPYYASYTTEDFGAIARACGLTHVRDVCVALLCVNLGARSGNGFAFRDLFVVAVDGGATGFFDAMAHSWTIRFRRTGSYAG